MCGAAWVWTRGGLAGCVGQPGSGLKVGYLGMWGSLGLDSRWVTWAAWVWTQGGLAGCVGQPGSGLKVG